MSMDHIEKTELCLKYERKEINNMMNEREAQESKKLIMSTWKRTWDIHAVCHYNMRSKKKEHDYGRIPITDNSVLPNVGKGGKFLFNK